VDPKWSHAPPAPAIAEARERLGLARGAPTATHVVEGLEGPGTDYYLIVFGEPGAAVGVATADAVTGELTSWAALPGTRAHLPLDGGEAIRVAGMPDGARARLVWRPSPASRSPLYPLWAVSTDDAVVYVDQQGQVSSSLEPRPMGG
jgi:hypothetical protein